MKSMMSEQQRANEAEERLRIQAQVHHTHTHTHTYTHRSSTWAHIHMHMHIIMKQVPRLGTCNHSIADILGLCRERRGEWLVWRANCQNSQRRLVTMTDRENKTLWLFSKWIGLVVCDLHTICILSCILSCICLYTILRTILHMSVYYLAYYFAYVCILSCILLVYYRKLKERITQLDSENTALTKAHVER